MTFEFVYPQIFRKLLWHGPRVFDSISLPFRVQSKPCLHDATSSPLHPRLSGSGKGGDCDHLLLASSPLKYIKVRAHGGEILIDGTHVESWDMSAGGVDENYDDGRRCTPPTQTNLFLSRSVTFVALLLLLLLLTFQS